MATRKYNKNRPSAGSQAIVIFWLVFVIVIISVFMLNAETIKRNFNLLKTRLTSPHGMEEELPFFDEEIFTDPTISDPPLVVTVEPSPRQTETTQSEQQTTPAQQEQRTETQQPPAPPVQTRDRTIYFTQIDKDGQILQSRVIRRLPVSDSPLVDTLNAMLAGPSAEELNRGTLNLVPQNTRILSATVRGSTAYISFNEDFLFNTFGVEGYVAQLRQIVWTATEFSNVNDVQFLIEGRRLDYLGEGIWIGSPISRQSF